MPHLVDVAVDAVADGDVNEPVVGTQRHLPQGPILILSGDHYLMALKLSPSSSGCHCLDSGAQAVQQAAELQQAGSLGLWFHGSLTAGLARFFVSGYSREPAPPPRMMPSTVCMASNLK